MRRIVINEHRSLFRKRRVAEELRGDLADTLGGQQLGGQQGPEEQHALLDALRALGPRQRAVVVLRYWLDLSEAETAAALNCSVGTVKSQGSRALATLRKTAGVRDAARGRGHRGRRPVVNELGEDLDRALRTVTFSEAPVERVKRDGRRIRTRRRVTLLAGVLAVAAVAAGVPGAGQEQRRAAGPGGRAHDAARQPRPGCHGRSGVRCDQRGGRADEQDGRDRQRARSAARGGR